MKSKSLVPASDEKEKKHVENASRGGRDGV
jgi:hypothetical protein